MHWPTAVRGGKVLLVTNLDDYRPGRDEPVPGSLRAACETIGPRIVVFRVAGTIALKTTLNIAQPFITIAGQSSPGDGVCLKHYGVSIRTHDVIVQYMRLRPGDELGSVYKKRGRSFEPDALSINAGSRDVIIDHCSASWSIDECLSVSGADITNVTVQWCLIRRIAQRQLSQQGTAWLRIPAAHQRPHQLPPQHLCPSSLAQSATGHVRRGQHPARFP